MVEPAARGQAGGRVGRDAAERPRGPRARLTRGRDSGLGTTGAIHFRSMAAGAPVSETHVATVDPAHDAVETGDFDGDGKADIRWRHPPRVTSAPGS